MRRLFLLFLFINFSISAYNQVVKGTILDKDTKRAIDFASLYFSGTFVGTHSDPNGNFELDISRYASMPLTISAIGYFSVTLTDYSPTKPLLIYMTPKVYELMEVTVKAKSLVRERRENLKIFRNEFLGTTGNALNCVIINENDITFNYGSDNDTLRAYASKPILMENRALGYKITYYLDKFEYYKESKSFFFKGNMLFDQDLSTEETQKQLFDRRRKYAYLGSRMHFFRTLWVNDLKSTGFKVKNSADEYLTYRDIVIEENGRNKYLRYKEDLGICYYTNSPNSYLVLLKDKIHFDATGYYDASGISWEGTMAGQRIADWLPYEYSIK